MPRRIKVLQPDSPFIEISAPRSVNGEPLKQTKIAAGMEIYFVVKFKPQEVRDYSLDLMCVTEREKFLVPVRAVGSRPKMNFPDQLHFGSCPVKSTSRKMVLVQNIGSTVAKFRMRPTHPAFSCSQDDKSVEPGSSQMLEFYFTPQAATDVSAEIEVEYTKTMKCYISVTGSGKNVDVSLSTPSLSMEPAYISLATQKTLRINNLSDIPIKFAWKSYATVEEEENERERLHIEIGRMEKMEQAALREGVYNTKYIPSFMAGGGRDGEDSEGELSGDEGDLPFEARAAQASLIRKYRNLRRALEKDTMLFVDDIFEISPCEGEVWPRSEIEITCTFRPDTAAHFTCLAHLDISGREDRLNLTLSGQGIGPHAALSFDILDFGDVFVNSEVSYELSIANKGDIPAQWGFISSLTRFGNKFTFTPTDGTLEVGQVQPIKLRFISDVLGEFSEHFRFGLQGNEETLMCQVKGQVIGPTFHFDCKSIEFGAVSFDYLHSVTVRLVNTSKISMTYHLHVPQDGSFQKKEFNITPSDGTLLPEEHAEIQVEFIPGSVKVYAYSLAVDVMNVGEMLLSIPINAECFSSSLSLKERDIQYGEVFIRHPYVRELTLINNSDIVFTKFQVLPQQQYTKTIACYVADPPYGVVPPDGEMSIKIRMTAEKLGNSKVPVMISIAGSQEPPIQAALVCTAVGPRVLVDKTELRWGNMECLKDSPRVLKVTNDSLIPADVKLFLKTMRSKFELSWREAVLQPKETVDLVITANLDDTVVHNDELHLFVLEGENLMIPLSAKGVGTTMYCGQDLTTIDFGVQLTNTQFEKRITLENKGRRQQALRWTNKTIRDENHVRLAKAKKLLGKDNATGGVRLPKNLMPLEPHFTVAPAEIILRPRTAVTFIFKGSCTTIGRIEEVFILDSRVGKERSTKQIMMANVCSEIVDPLLDFSERVVPFEYRWVEDEKPQQFRRDVVLTNKSAVVLTFVLKTEVPFNLSSYEHTLQPGQSVEVSVEFHPFYRDDRTSHIVEKPLLVAYRGHPQKDSITLRGEVIYPNIEFEQTSINFGCVLNETTKTIRVKATNWSKVDAAYQWFFLEDEVSKTSRTKKKSTALPTSQVFDILPIRSVLRPGESEDLEFVMYGHENHKFSGKAICEVKGGPEYTILLSGEASTVSYSLDRSIIDFGKVVYNERRDEELGILNQGLVAFNFEIATDDLSSPGIIDVLPSSGKVMPGERFKVLLRVRPWRPEYIAEYVIVKVAHFDPVKLMCYCHGVFPAIVATLPRQKKQGPLGEKDNLELAWKQFIGQAKENISNPDKSKLAPDPALIAPPVSGTTAVPPVYQPDQDVIEFGQTDGDTTEGGTHGRSTSRDPSQILVEVEMQRLTLCHYLESVVEDMKSKPLPTGASRRGTYNQMYIKNIDAQTILTANYLCDFGYIILSTNKKRLFKIVNASTAGPISWTFDKRLLVGTGFGIDPEKVARLPDGASVDFTVKFAANTKMSLGRKQVTLPLVVKGAPKINVILYAHVCLPDIEMSTDVIDFERVQLGRSRKMFFFLKNTSPVTANWLLKKVGSGKEESKFIIEPDQGSIRAGQKIIVSVEFIPSEARKYSISCTMRIEMNSRSRTISFTGEGLAPMIRFDPPIVELGPILPFAEGAEKIVTIHNDSDAAVDVFSLDYDTIYKEEDIILSAIEIYGPDGVFRSAIRAAGDPLPQSILDTYKKALMTDVKGDDNGPAFADAPLRNEGSPRDTNRHQDIIVIGPPLIGVNTMSRLLSSKLSLPLRTIDEMLDEVGNVSGALGLKVRRILRRLPVDETIYLKSLEDDLLASAERSKVDAEAAYRKEKKGKVKEIPPEVLITPQVLAYQAFMDEVNFNENLLADVIKYRLSWADVGYGLVINGLTSRYVKEEMLVKALKISIPSAIIAKLSVFGGESGYSSHLASLFASKTALVTRVKAAFKAEEAAEKKKETASRSPTRAGSPSRASVAAAATQDPKNESHIVHRKELVGDEFWYDQKTGMVLELSADDAKAVEEDQRELYQSMLKKQRMEQLASAEDFLKKLSTVWTKAQGLRKTSTLASVSSKNLAATMSGEVDTNVELFPEKLLTYSDYIEILVPLITHYFGETPELPTEPSVNLNDASGADSGSPIPNTVGAAAAAAAAAVTMENFLSLDGESQSTTTLDHGIFEVEIEPEDSKDIVFSTMMALLPPPMVPPPDKDALPLPRNFQIIRKPFPRIDRKLSDKFEMLLTLEEKPKSAPAPPPSRGSSKPTGRKSSTHKDKPVPVAEPPPVEAKPKYRWVIPPQGSASFRIKFASNVEGRFETTLGFEVTGSYQQLSLLCLGQCEVPHIQNDPRTTFMRRIKALAAGAPPPQRRFIVADNYYSFGPLLHFKQPDWRIEAGPDASKEEKQRRDMVQSNCDMIRLSNNGHYKCQVELGFEEPSKEDSKDVFYVEPPTLELAEGESKDIKIWAFPNSSTEFKNNLVICVSNNPHPIMHEVRCVGVDPTVELEGPWTESINTMRNTIKETKDAKKLKELETKLNSMIESPIIDFERLLLNKTDVRTFEVRNTCLLPVAWEINPDDFVDSQHVTLAPTSGVLAVGASSAISVSFTSQTAMILEGKFTFRYSDVEGGLQAAERVKTRTMKVTAEAYSIQAVTLTSEGGEEGGNEVDFGLMKVGDYAAKSVRMGNKGKYKIGFNVTCRRASTAAMVTIEPNEGVIEPGKDAEINLTFCNTEGELKLKGNRDVRILISEPVTGETVEEFPLVLSAMTRYSNFRLQPSKGISFGAVRFDSDVKTRRVELKNEGTFEITYLVTAATSEHNELDTLDSVALSCFAYNTPAALRAKQLGEGYLGRMLNSRPNSKSGSRPNSKKEVRKKETKETKGSTSKKGAAAAAAPAPAAVETSGNQGNSLIVDPDNLQVATLPTNPLLVGAFTVLPRIGYVQPGESAGIDISFNPAGCDSVREKLRFFITGVNENDAPAQMARSFEVSGDSCFPAITVDDVHTIFEEQEVVKSLSDVIAPADGTGGNNAGQGSSKIEKLAVGKVVYAETERMLAFGPIVCGTGQGKGAVERIRISNPTKIDTRVKCRILMPEAAAAEAQAIAAAPKPVAKTPAKAGKAGGKQPAATGVLDAPTESQSFKVEPEFMDIPPHEHRYVNIFFNPTEIKSYRSVFVAEVDEEDFVERVENRIPGAGKRLMFDLGGTGTMPCISVESPTTRDEEGNLLVQFGRVHVQRVSKKKLVIRNDGVMPATCLFDMSGDDDFPFQCRGSSITLNPGDKQELMIQFAPQKADERGSRSATIKVSVLNNLYDHYLVKLLGTTYACDAIIEINQKQSNSGKGDVDGLDKSEEEVYFDHINLLDGPRESKQIIVLKSRSDHFIRFDFNSELGGTAVGALNFSPAVGHLGPRSAKEIELVFAAEDPIKLEGAKVNCSLKRIEYPLVTAESDVEMQGSWDDSMKVVRPATQADLDKIAAEEKAMKEYRAKNASDQAKSTKKLMKSASVIAPVSCGIHLAPSSPNGPQMVYETVTEPVHTVIPTTEAQTLQIRCHAVADVAKFKCEIPNGQIHFKATFLFQSTVYNFPFVNESNINLPVKWMLENIKRRLPTRASTSQSRGRVTSGPSLSNTPSLSSPCPFVIEPAECVVSPNTTMNFSVKFQPQEVDDYIYLLRGETPSSASNEGGNSLVPGPLKAVIRGVSKRPICHFEVVDCPDYLTRRLPNMKNENGVNSPIEAADIRIIEADSTGLRSRNTYRFYVINPTNENYEFLWEPMGDPSPAWRCALSAGLLYSGKRVEMIFEYLPEDMAVAEAFYKFRLPSVGLEQIFLFAGKVTEPRVSFSVAKIDFHSVMLGGTGNTETIYIDNQEHLPFNFTFDRSALAQLEGPSGPILDISPKSGAIPPHGRVPVMLTFKPQEEVVYNFNIQCEVKRKPNKLSLNIKGEGYAVHPVIQIEESDSAFIGSGGRSHFVPLRPTPATNYADFGSVQVLDTVSKKIIVGNTGKYNFDYVWDTNSMGSALALTGGKLGGTLQKGGEMTYTLSFSPQREYSLEGGAMLSFTVAGKYTYNIIARGSGVKPALRFSFMHHDFGSCFVTSPGGSTVVEEAILRVVNHDPTNNISVECTFQKTRALWVECQPTVLDPGAVLDIPIRFAPREIKDYTFIVPFVVNGTGKVAVTVNGRGISARLELVNQGQRRLNFGVVNVNTEVRKTVMLVNRSRKALPVQLIEEGEYGIGTLQDRCITFSPSAPFTMAPKETVPIQLTFNPTRRIPLFTEDLNVSYAGVTRKLLSVSGKAQGLEVSLDTDSLPFGTVVLDSQKVKKLRLDNSGDLAISFEWLESTFGPHFNISPLSGKLAPGTEVSFDVTFRPKFVDGDVRQDRVTLLIPGMSPLSITCSGACISQPSDSVSTLRFESLARKQQEKVIKVANSSDKDWFVSPAFDGIHWRGPHELKIPAKGSANLTVTYFPLTMCVKTDRPPSGQAPAANTAKGNAGGTAAATAAAADKNNAAVAQSDENAHRGKLFLALPDGSALQYNLIGIAGPPECAGTVTVETPAKKPASLLMKLSNWLPEAQTFRTAITITEKPSQSTFIIAANAVEVGPNGTKDFHARYSTA